LPLQVEYREVAAEYTRAAKHVLRDSLVSICFFGSAARGEASQESDLDALVVAERIPNDLAGRVRLTSGIREEVRRSDAARRLRMSGRSPLISTILLTPEEAQSHPPIFLDIADHGIVEYDRDSFLGGVLNDIRRRLRELGAKRVHAKKGYYWILKPGMKPSEVVEI